MRDTAEDGSSLAGVPNLQVKVQLTAKPGVADSPKPSPTPSALVCSEPASGHRQSGYLRSARMMWKIRGGHTAMVG